jgi:circadian clock protein KaiC
MTLTTHRSTGVEGLDELLYGGLMPRRTYLVQGPPGSSKTILALHFLQAGLDDDERVLFINLEADLDDLEENAAALGFDTDAIAFPDLSPTADVFVEDRTTTCSRRPRSNRNRSARTSIRHAPSSIR